MDWFKELKKHRTSDKKEQSEDFLTINLIEILNLDKEFLNEFLESIFGKIKYSQIKIYNHYVLKNRKIPDILVKFYNEDKLIVFIGIIECKIDSKPDDCQIYEYVKQAKQEFQSIETKVSFIGRYPKQDLKNITGNIITWWDIYELIDKDSKNNVNNYLRKELKKLMNFEGISPPKKIDKDWINNVTVLSDYLSNLKNFNLKITEMLISNFNLDSDFNIRPTINENEIYYYSCIENKSGENIFLEIGWENDSHIPLFIGYKNNNGGRERHNILADIDFWGLDLNSQFNYLFDKIVKLLKEGEYI